VINKEKEASPASSLANKEFVRNHINKLVVMGPPEGDFSDNDDRKFSSFTEDNSDANSDLNSEQFTPKHNLNDTIDQQLVQPRTPKAPSPL